jgi:hypothetical protein
VGPWAYVVSQRAAICDMLCIWIVEGEVRVRVRMSSTRNYRDF